MFASDLTSTLGPRCKVEAYAPSLPIDFYELPENEQQEYVAKSLS